MNYKERERCIRDIRARLPYLTVRELEWIAHTARSYADPAHGFSVAEHDRPVLTPEDQAHVDTGATAARCIGYAISEEFSEGYCLAEAGCTQATPLRILGEYSGEDITLDALAVAQICKESGHKRIKRDTLFQAMEAGGYILPRTIRPKQIRFRGEWREVLYTTFTQLRPFLREDSIILPRDPGGGEP